MVINTLHSENNSSRSRIISIGSGNLRAPSPLNVEVEASAGALDEHEITATTWKRKNKVSLVGKEVEEGQINE